MHLCIYVFMYLCVYVFLLFIIFVYLFIYLYFYIFIYIYIYIYIFIYICAHTLTHIDFAGIISKFHLFGCIAMRIVSLIWWYWFLLSYPKRCWIDSPHVCQLISTLPLWTLVIYPFRTQYQQDRNCHNNLCQVGTYTVAVLWVDWMILLDPSQSPLSWYRWPSYALACLA